METQKDIMHDADKFVWLMPFKGMYLINKLGVIAEPITKNGKDYIKYLPTFIHKNGYVKAQGYNEIGQRTFFIHEEMANIFLDRKPYGLRTIVIHIDGDKTNNRLDNLKVIENSDGFSSKYIGVSRDKRGYTYRANINSLGFRQYLGSFYTEEEANESYIEAYKENHKEIHRVFDKRIT